MQKKKNKTKQKQKQKQKQKTKSQCGMGSSNSLLLLQAFCSSITGTLATQAMLKGYGVGDENATAMAATITWILRSMYMLICSNLTLGVIPEQLGCGIHYTRTIKFQ